jgi:hypothetical protein
MSDNVIPFVGAGDSDTPPTEPPQVGGRQGPDVCQAKVVLSHAITVLDLLLNTLDESLGPLGKQDLANLECNLGLRDGTLTTSLYLILQECDSARELLDRPG